VGVELSGEMKGEASKKREEANKRRSEEWNWHRDFKIEDV
jgi:hypothetical protein